MVELSDEPLPIDERRRLSALRATGLLDSPPEESFDRLTRLARIMLDAPLSRVSLIDERRQFVKSSSGLENVLPPSPDSPLSYSLCRYVVAAREPLVIDDAAADARVCACLAVSEMGAGAYLGFPIRFGGEVLGSFCVIDLKPRHWTPREISVVRDLAAVVESEIALRDASGRANRLAEQTVRQQQQTAILLHALEEGVYGVDLDGACTFINRAALQMLGYRHEDEVLGHVMHDLIHHTRSDGSHYPKTECPIVDAIRTGDSVQLANEILWRRDGTPFAAEYSASPIQVDGRLVGSVLTFNDVTLRQDALRRLSVLFAVSRTLAATPHDAGVMTRALAAIGIGLGWDVGAFWAPERSGDALRCAATWVAPSIQAEDFLRVSQDARFGRGRGLPGVTWQAAEPQMVVDVARDPRLVRRAEAALAGLQSAFAFPAMADGEVLGVIEFYMRGSLQSGPSLMQSVVTLGELLGQFLKRQATKQDLRLSRQAMEAASTGISISDATLPSMPLVYCNPAFERITGYSQAEALGRNCRFLQGPDTAQPELDEVRAALREQRDCRVILRNYRKDGSEFWNALTLSPVFGRGGVLTHFVGVQTDVTERRRAVEALAAAKLAAEDANQAKSRFIANMSHELRTPISAVIGYSELLEEEVGDLGVEGTAVILDDIRKIRGSARHLLDLINEVLDLSKMEAGKMDVQAVDFDLRGLVAEVAETAEALMKKKANRLVVDFGDAPLGIMHSDPVKVRRCLYNLLGNAAKFTEQGLITLHARREPGDAAGRGDRLRLRVDDTGIGMTAEQVERLFERFAQADSSTTRRFGGTGLGLALTRSLCRMLGGEVSVRSVAGAGTSFEIVLPVDFRRVGVAQPSSAAADGGNAVAPDVRARPSSVAGGAPAAAAGPRRKPGREDGREPPAGRADGVASPPASPSDVGRPAGPRRSGGGADAPAPGEAGPAQETVDG